MRRSPDPCNMGALLCAALARAGLSAAEVARRCRPPMAESNVSRALSHADTRPVVVRRILLACGARLTLA